MKQEVRSANLLGTQYNTGHLRSKFGQKNKQGRHSVKKMDTFLDRVKGNWFPWREKETNEKDLVRKMSQNDHYLECLCDLDDEAEGLGGYWGGSLIVYVECMVHPLKGILILHVWASGKLCTFQIFFHKAVLICIQRQSHQNRGVDFSSSQILSP